MDSKDSKFEDYIYNYLVVEKKYPIEAIIHSIGDLKEKFESIQYPDFVISDLGTGELIALFEIKAISERNKFQDVMQGVKSYYANPIFASCRKFAICFFGNNGFNANECYEIKNEDIVPLKSLESLPYYEELVSDSKIKEEKAGVSANRESVGNQNYNESKIVEQLIEMSMYAQVAFVARCARRLLPLFSYCWKGVPEERIKVVEDAVTMIESYRLNMEESENIYEELRNIAIEVSNMIDKENSNINEGAVHIAVAISEIANAIAYSIGDNHPEATASISKSIDRIINAIRQTPWERQIAKEIKRDCDNLVKANAENTLPKDVVSPEFFGALWPEGKPEGWPDYEDVNTIKFNVGYATSMSDEPTNEDLLGRDDLISALASNIKYNEKVKGYTIAIMGDWGAGKSSVVEMLKNKLGYKDFLYADFNAWEYEHCDNIAAAMTQEFVKGLTCNLKWKEKLYLWMNFTKDINENELIKIKYWFVITFIIFIIFVLYPKLYAGMTLGSLISFFVLYYFNTIKNLKKVIDHPLTAKLDIYTKLPEYGKYLGLRPILKKHLYTLCKYRLSFKIKEVDYLQYLNYFHNFRPIKCLLTFLTGQRYFEYEKEKRLVFVIDDLDRCKPECIAKVFDASRLVMDIENVIILICIDHRIAFRAISKHYKDLVEQTVDGRDGSDIARDYLGKIIHLPINLPDASEEGVAKFIKDKLIKNVFENDQDRWRGSGMGVGAGNGDGDGSGAGMGVGAGNGDGDGSGAGMGAGAGNGDGDGSGAELRNINESEMIKEKEEDVIDESDMIETPKERDDFIRLSTIFKFTNPRQLLRLRNSFRILKKLNENYTSEQVMTQLFWQEFRNSQPKISRQYCREIIENNQSGFSGDIDKIPTHIKIIVDQLCNGQHDIKVLIYESDDVLIKFVEISVLPHGNDGYCCEESKSIIEEH